MEKAEGQGRAMTRQGWAEKVIARTFQAHKGPLTGYAVKALRAEHRRAVRVVKAEMKRVKLSEYQYGAHEKAYILTALDNVLAALQKGRT